MVMQNRLRHSGNICGILGSRGGQSWSSLAPTLLSATVISDTRIDLAWTNNDTTGDGVSIERSTDGITYAEIDTVALGVAAYSDTTGLAIDTIYYYRVRAFKN